MGRQTSLEHLDNFGLFFEGGKSPLTFFRDCLSESLTYKRAAGYFSSSVFIAITDSLLDFINRNGMIKLICSPRLMPQDVEEIQRGTSTRLVHDEVIRREVIDLLSNVETKSAAKILGLLIASGNLEIKIASKKVVESGIFHSKVGVFCDSNGGKVAFIGSTNETWSGWSDYGNFESFMAKSSYRGPESQEDVAALERYFDDLWDNRVFGLEVLGLSESSSKVLIESARTENLRDLIEDAKRVVKNAKVSGKVSKKPSNRELMQHQKAVIDSWRDSGQVGIIDHATGSGKTITALHAIKDWIREGRPAVVIVPSSLLQRQWHSEIKAELNLEPLLVGGENSRRDNWMSVLSDYTRKDRDFGPRVTLCVLASASKGDFKQRLQVSNDLLFVCDEVHTIGQRQSRELLEKVSTSGARLGLSATYERFGDPDGTKAIEKCFGKPLLPRFTIVDAIREGRLVPYEYHFGMVSLDGDELEDYEDLSEQIRKLYAREGDKNDFSKFSSNLKRLIFQRASIIKGARNKAPFAKRIIQENYKLGDKWLVYCDDTSQMRSVEALLDKSDIPVLTYFDAMEGDKSETLRVFSDRGGVLLAIKCLDEGIDIPSATHALILASSQNPREYIQRRGRVLRSDPGSGKYRAVIWDVLAVDQEGVPVTDVEIHRMVEFAKDATNSMVSVEILEIMSKINEKRGTHFDYFTEDSIDDGVETSRVDS